MSGEGVEERGVAEILEKGWERGWRNTQLIDSPDRGYSAFYDALGALEPSDHLISIQTNRSRERIEEAARTENIYSIECRKPSPPEQEPTHLYVPSPSDLTGIGVKFSDVLDYLDDEGVESDDVYVSVDSVNLTMIYTDESAAFRFFHVLTGRVENIGARGVYNSFSGGMENPGTIRKLMDSGIAYDEGSGTYALWESSPETGED